jgi:hypothetical protein
MKKMKVVFKFAAIIAFASTGFAEAKKEKEPSQVLFKNVHVWDGTSDGITKKSMCWWKET